MEIKVPIRGTGFGQRHCAAGSGHHPLRPPKENMHPPRLFSTFLVISGVHAGKTPYNTEHLKGFYTERICGTVFTDRCSQISTRIVCGQVFNLFFVLVFLFGPIFQFLFAFLIVFLFLIFCFPHCFCFPYCFWLPHYLCLPLQLCCCVFLIVFLFLIVFVIIFSFLSSSFILLVFLVVCAFLVLCVFLVSLVFFLVILCLWVFIPPCLSFFFFLSSMPAIA